ncbi:MAG: hypothetical protein HOM31_11950 [Gemmatimonadetes bacterium]|nr:hypothetical protein [Gemmatimonadota bacterium]
MRRLSIAVMLLALPIAASADWDIGIESVAPLGDFEDVAGGGGGLYVQRLHPLNDNLLLSSYLGAISYGGIKALGVEIQWYGYPITIGGAYYLNGVDQPGLFIKANAGLLYKIGTVEFSGDKEEFTDTGYVISPGIGWNFGSANVTADYNLGNDSWTWFAVKVAYRFGM